jgi:NADP-dependent aldehyde dehydrogenase
VTANDSANDSTGQAFDAARETGMPPALVQLIYRTSHEDGYKLASHTQLKGLGYTGGRVTGLALKRRADAAGIACHMQLGSTNPVFILPGCIAAESERDDLVAQLTTSSLMGCGQLGTNPGLVVLLKGLSSDALISGCKRSFEEAPVGTLLGPAAAQSFSWGLRQLQEEAGAELICGGKDAGGKGFCYENTIFKVTGVEFLEDPTRMQTECFGNAITMVVCDDVRQMTELCHHLEGSLTGCIYSDANGSDDSAYWRVAPVLRTKVGRLLNDKMPTVVAVSPPQDHGGPSRSPSPALTAVGIPASLARWCTLRSYDNLRPERLPPSLQDTSPNPKLQRFIDGVWRTGHVQVKPKRSSDKASL